VNIRWCLPIAALAVACGPSGDRLHIYYDFARGSEQTCIGEDGDPVENCTGIPMTCDSVALLRILDPDTGKIWVDQCGTIPRAAQDDLCPITRAFAEFDPIPTTRTLVQLAVYNRADLMTDDDGNPVCPADLKFTATKFIAPTNSPMPALAGMEFTDGFDNEVTVMLGCNDTALIDTLECRNESALDFTASVLDLDLQIPVGTMTAANLSVRVGSPIQSAGVWTLDLASTFELSLVPGQARWFANDVNIDLHEYLCLQLIQTEERGAAPVTCRTLPDLLPTAFDVVGYHVNALTVDDVLGALGLPDVPNAGMVIGIVVDQQGNPVDGVTVTDSGGSTIKYLSSDRTNDDAPMTTDAGIFMSTNAELQVAGEANHWSGTRPDTIQVNDPIGGKITDRLSIVVIQMTIGF
jgi:hypothetical protein